MPRPDRQPGIAGYYQANRCFPRDPTLDQLFSADRFDAYRSLGALAAGIGANADGSARIVVTPLS